MSDEVFRSVSKKLGLGCMRFPLTSDGAIDIETVKKMVDLFIKEGFNYFDTAHGYLNGRSEGAVKEALTSRYPRESYLLADKLSNGFFKKEEDIRPLFESQLAQCGVGYFDYYLMHALDGESYKKYCSTNAFTVASRLKEEGKIRHVGMSFHDSADVLRKILSEQKVIEFVQLQINYADWEDEKVQSRLCYETCVEFGCPVIVMEPVKGGNLSSLHPEAEAVFNTLEDRGSNASYALRFVNDLENVKVILSGMSSMEQVEDNIKTFKAPKPLDENEKDAIRKAAQIIKREGSIACTKCNYCTEVCPVDMPIPSIFAVMNRRDERSYDEITHKVKASACLKCGKCEKTCPQHLPIRRYLEQAAFRYEKAN